MKNNAPVFDFSGKTVLVTGSTSGIGEATAKAFGRSGANVMLTGRNAERGSSVQAAIVAAGGTAAFTVCDVTDSSDCNRLLATTAAHYGSLDILVNSAGVIYHATAEETTDDQWRETMAVNVDGVFFASRAAVPALRKAGGGVIVNIASDAGVSGSRHLVAYCASKAAVIHMTRAMAIDHAAENIRLVAVCPGDVDTPMLRGEFVQRDIEATEGLVASAAGVPLGRVCTPEEVAGLVLYAATDSARFMTGTALTLDGGSNA